jgi:response regulator RpfG family c-di-GMP phosphodiesterase
MPWTLLFVDDEQNILSALNRLFRKSGHRILTATSGARGLEILEQEPVDLVVSDMRMPEMDGAAFLEQVYRRWPDVTRLLLTGYSDIESTIAAVNKGQIYRYLQKPWEEYDLQLTVHHALEAKRLAREQQKLETLIRKQNLALKELNQSLEAKVAARTQDLQRAAERLQEAHDTLKKSYTATVEVFANLIEMRKTGVATDARQVASQAHALALHLGMSESEARHVLFAGLLHDIGKIGLPDHLIDKPYNALTAPERAQVAQHPALSETLLMAIAPLQDAARIIRTHRERPDGKGYPDGLQGDQIPSGARILGVVNDYYELQLGLIAPERYTASQAQQFLRENRQRRYHGPVVDAFLEWLETTADQTATEAEQCVGVTVLRPGMVLTRDVYTRGKLLLLAKGHVLDETIVAKLSTMETRGEEWRFYVRMPP